ncbi:MAG: hypothetical protein SF123_15925 [Chloroflexota bacterium]|nr:hypothetical protein [Chloroflexota bacterium]
METDRRQALLNALPFSLLALVFIAIALLQPDNDLTRFFLPAGRLLLGGSSPYGLSRPEDAQPFIYTPYSLWLFMLMAAVPASVAYLGMLALNAGLLVVVIQRLQLSRWWCLYPPGLFVALAGQLDVLVFWLGLEAYHRRNRSLSCLLICVGLAIKPQIALFWLLPWFYSLPTHRQRLRYAAICLATFALPMLLWFLADSSRVLQLWGDWGSVLRAGTGAYVGDSPSLWSIGLLPAALLALVLWLVFGRNQQLSRPLLALGLPALRYYSSYGLVGAAPLWGLALAYGVAGLSLVFGQPLFWIEPLVTAVYRLRELLLARALARQGEVYEQGNS